MCLEKNMGRKWEAAKVECILCKTYLPFKFIDNYITAINFWPEGCQ